MYFSRRSTQMIGLGRRWRCVLVPRRPPLGRSYRPVEPPIMIDTSRCPDGWKETNATVYHRVVEKTAAFRLQQALEKACKSKRFSKSHWDSVIQKYKEFSILEDDLALFSPFEKTVFEPIRTLIRENHLSHRTDTIKWLPPHVIDLHRDGTISAHVDSTRFSGEVVCGLSMKSTCIMRLRPANEDGTPNRDLYDKYVDLLLEPLSLYVLQGDGRYKYTHEILPSNSIFNISGEKPCLVSREPRCSIIFRDDQLQLRPVPCSPVT